MHRAIKRSKQLVHVGSRVPPGSVPYTRPWSLIKLGRSRLPWWWTGIHSVRVGGGPDIKRGKSEKMSCGKSFSLTRWLFSLLFSSIMSSVLRTRKYGARVADRGWSQSGNEAVSLGCAACDAMMNGVSECQSDSTRPKCRICHKRQSNQAAIALQGANSHVDGTQHPDKTAAFMAFNFFFVSPIL